MKKFKLTPLEKCWIGHDIGNSAFIMMVSTLFPIFFNALAEDAGISSVDYLAYWGYAGSIATLLVALIGPICGTLADRKGFRKPLFALSLAVGAIGCAVLGFSSSWVAFLVIYVVTKVGYSSSLVFYDSMLPEVTTESRMDEVSSRGYAYGYIGSVIPFAVCLMVVLMPQTFALTTGSAMCVAFAITAVWWLGMTVPLMRRYHQSAYAPQQGHPFAAAFRQLGKTLRNLRQEKHVFLYLLSYFFFIDGVYTIIDMATAYGTALGLDTTGLLLALLVTQIVAFPFAIAFGRLSSKYNTGLLIKICIAAYTGITVFAMFLSEQWEFWVLAVLVGMFQGGIQALSRSYLGKIIPPQHSGEYFGLMDICGKGASFVGMLLVSAVTQLTGNESVGVGALVLMFAVGFALFCKADRLCRDRRSV